MSEFGGFWSYSHADDAAEGGRIAQLARDVVAQYEMMTGDSISLFLDRDTLAWGDDWKLKIDSSLSSVAFFISILTPRYFQSVECRRELNFFARRATELGVKDLVLPILYVNVPKFNEDSPADPLISLVRTFQWEDWTDLRFATQDSSDYRRAVARLATRLADASVATENVAQSTPIIEAPSSPEDDAPGFFDLVANAEEAMPKWAENLQSIAEQIVILGDVMTEATTDIKDSDARGKGMAGRIRIFQDLATKLEDPSSQLEELGGQFTALLLDVDAGITAILDRIPEELTSSSVQVDEVHDFVDSITELTTASESGLSLLDDLISSLTPAEKSSRSLRPAMRKLRRALTLIAEGRDVMRTWARKINELDLPPSAIASHEA